ncbi:MAG: GEVED domain-containing protein, partial [Saprospiraceae bacterium]
TSDGVFKTEDGGTTWDHQLTETVLIDLEFQPGNPQTLYGSSFDGEIFVSTSGGEFWTRTLWEFDADRTELAVTPAQPTWVYAVAARGALEGIYKSTDSGTTFNKVFDGETKNLLHWNASGIGSGGQGYYDLAIDVSPFDPNLLLVGGINTWRSNDGGLSWNIVNHFGGVGVQTVHADKHNLRFRSNGDLWECNDGGIYVSKDQGTTWRDKTNGMAISQIYKLGVSATEQDEVIAGLQDNGSKLHTATGWKQVNGSDGMEAIIDHTDVNIQYSTTQGGSFFRTYDHWESARHVKPQDAGAGAWVTPFVMDPENPRTIYGGYNEIWKTTDRGDTWIKVSSIHAANKIRLMAIAPSDSRVIYAGESYSLYKSTTGGEPFVKVTGNVPNQTNALSYLAVKHDDPQTVWMAVSGFSAPGVFQTIDGGTTWTNISSGLPPIPVYSVVQNKQANDEIQLFAGTELGVYFRKGEADWIPFSTGLPNVIVTELEMYYSKDPTLSKLRASTYGRGLWETRVEFESSPMDYVSSTTKQNDTTSIKPGQNDQEILKIEITTTGDLEPIHIQSFTFNTEGSTDPQNDISAARLYSTGNVNGFLKTELFGQFDSAPNGEFTITGDIALISGVNYFWLAYDVPADAKLWDLLDAQCTSFNLGEVMAPSKQSPEGSRKIDLIYCKAGATTISGEYISHVRMGDVDQESEKDEDGYQDFTDQVVKMEIGKITSVEVTNIAPQSTNELYIWIDWNQDGTFHLQDERVYASGPLGISTYTASIIPPEGAKLDLTTMRIRLNDINFGSNDAPCGNANFGEVEDYSIHLVEENITSETPISDQHKVSVFPNPVTHELNIAFTEMESGNVEVDFYSPHGTLVLKKDLLLIAGKASLSLTGIHSGMYLMKIKSGSDVWFERIVKQ